MTTTEAQSTTEETRVKERLNLFYHGLKEREKPTMFREVREWLREMDDAETESLHSIICGVVHRHCKDVQLPSGTNGLENDLIQALSVRISPASAAVDALCMALETAINSVECGSIDSNTGEELPWYKQAHEALRLAGRPWKGIRHE